MAVMGGSCWCYGIACDGTRLGHWLAYEFPMETAQFDEAMDRLAHPDDYLRAPTSHDAPAEPSGVEGSEQR